MRKPAFCMCENKDADQLRSNCAADQRLCFRYTDSTISLLPKSEISPLAIFCVCTAWFVSDLVGDPEDRFSQNEAHIATASLSCVYFFPLCVRCYEYAKSFDIMLTRLYSFSLHFYADPVNCIVISKLKYLHAYRTLTSVRKMDK